MAVVHRQHFKLQTVDDLIDALKVIAHTDHRGIEPLNATALATHDCKVPVLSTITYSDGTRCFFVGDAPYNLTTDDLAATA